METLRAAADPRQSIPVLREKIKEDNRDVKSRYLLAKKYARDKNRDGLDQMIDQVTQIDPDNREGYLDNVVFLKLMTSLNPKQPKEGLRKCEFFLRDFPDSDLLGSGRPGKVADGLSGRRHTHLLKYP